jgi:hypothetical protein
MNVVTSGNLIISSDLNISEIQEFDMKIEKNCHTAARITGSVPDETGESPAFQKLEGSSITVTEADENGNEISPPIFCGFIKTVSILQEGNGYTAKIQAVSPTDLLDREEKCRSFQNIDMTYKELVRRVLADTANTEVIFRIEDRKIGVPVYQYKETDWEFLKRIAGQLGTSLLPGGVSNKPELYFRLPRGESRQGQGASKEKTWFDQSYDTYDKEQYHFSKSQFICHEISSYENWKVGDGITMRDNSNKVVLAKRCTLRQGLLVYTYTVGSPKAFGTARYDNAQMTGVSLAGTVLETKGECVRVSLDIDGAQNGQEVFWYPWLPDTGNVMYCMPEIGERIWITFDDGDGNARASGSIRENGTGNGAMVDPSKRYFTTAKDKRMYLLPDCLGFVDLKQKVPLKVEIHDSLGATIESSKELTVLAKKGVWLKASRISFLAPQEISLVRRDLASPAVINLCNGFDSIGKFGKVKMEGSGDAGFPVTESTDSGKYDLNGAENAVLTSTPCAAGSTKLERQITGTKVNFVTGQ